MQKYSVENLVAFLKRKAKGPEAKLRAILKLRDIKSVPALLLSAHSFYACSRRKNGRTAKGRETGENGGPSVNTVISGMTAKQQKGGLI